MSDSTSYPPSGPEYSDVKYDEQGRPYVVLKKKVKVKKRKKKAEDIQEGVIAAPPPSTPYAAPAFTQKTSSVSESRTGYVPSPKAKYVPSPQAGYVPPPSYVLPPASYAPPPKAGYTAYPTSHTPYGQQPPQPGFKAASAANCRTSYASDLTGFDALQTRNDQGLSIFQHYVEHLSLASLIPSVLFGGKSVSVSYQKQNWNHIQL